MRHIMKQIRIVFGVMLLAVWSASPVIAEDIEIYQKSNLGGAGVRPNILMILDTSGSMGNLPSNPTNTRPLYDPTIDYSEAGYAPVSVCSKFTIDEMYMLPSGAELKDIDCSNTYWSLDFKLTQNRCANLDLAMFGVRDVNGDLVLDANGLVQGAAGFAQDRYTQWRTNVNPDRWDNLDTANTTDYIECRSDAGDHGLDAAATNKWVGNGGGTQWAATDQGFAWDNGNSNRRTFYSYNYALYSVYAANNTAPALTKIEIMKSAIATILSGGVSDVDVGLMKFNGPGDVNGGTVMHPVVDIDLTRQDMLNTLKNWDADSWTPLTEVLYEAMRYFKGDAPLYGGLGADAIEGTTVLTDGSTKRYKSPVDQNAADCERQFIILLSDGEATRDLDANPRVEALPGFLGTDGTTGCYDAYGDSNGKCLDDLTKYMNEVGVDVALNDGVYGSTANAELTGEIAQNVKITTYTVGFDINSDLLTDAGHQGAGPDGYKPVADSNNLLQTLIDLIEEIKDIDTTFASPAVSVNAYNRTTHRADLYFTLFKPSNRPHWDGNFKRFKLAFDSAGVPEIVDVNDNPAIDPGTGFFAASAQSYWTAAADAPDGSQTEVGGTAGKLFTGATLATSRKVYTNLVSNVLTTAGNRIEDTNVNLTDAIMGVSGTDKTNLINWARGVDVTDDDGDGDSTDARRIMGDPLHAQPALVEYADGATADPYIVAYTATNDGYLHAFDTRTSVATAGTERFAFIPKELLPNLNAIFSNTSGAKQYGLDGTVTSWINDVDQDGVIESGDRVIIYFGMRRGGRNYYAMDVTNPDAPEVLWTIYGGEDATVNPGLGDFTELGQTWSTPQLRKIRLNGADVQVLIFAAGYDLDQDTATVRSADNMGRGIYIINATTGAIMWRMGPDGAANLTNANMIYSIPSDIAAADASGDGYVDHLYVGDMGGQLWRVDIDNDAGETTSNINNIITGGRIADLADASAASNRRFYYPPDIAILKDMYDASYLSILITSGNRSHPLNKAVQDRVFMIRDLPVFGKPASYTTITVNDSTQELFNTTSNLIGQGSVTERTDALTALQGSNGWYIDFDMATGEKGLTKPLIFAGEAFFATYEPADLSVASTGCGPNEGTGYLYHIHVENGTPVKNYDTTVIDSDDNLTAEDRRKTLTRSGIPADPTLIIPPDGAAICVGTECDKADAAGAHKRVYWFEE